MNPMSGYRISEVAARTGFSASTLRYYDDLGLVTPDRSEAGYRVYDERALERLGFVRRAKQLGLELDEVAELLDLWDGDRCAPVADRLRDLVRTKQAETEARIGELRTFSEQLRQVTAALGDTTSGDDACGPGCACHAQPAPAPAIACTLDPTDVPDRVEAWKDLLAHATGRTPIDGGLTVRFPPGPETARAVAALAAAEQACCSFFAFAIRPTSDATELDVRAPGEAAEVVHTLFG